MSERVIVRCTYGACGSFAQEAATGHIRAPSGFPWRSRGRLCRGCRWGARSISANFDFGQFRFRSISTFGQFDFGQLAEVELAEVEHPRKFVSCPKFRSFVVSGFDLCEFRRACCLLSCEAPAAPKPPGFHTTTRGPKRAHLRVPEFKNTTKIQRKDQQEWEKRMKSVAGEGRKRANFWGFNRGGVQRRGVQL